MTPRRKSPSAQRRLISLTLRELREKAGKTPKEVAAVVDRDTTWLNKAERAEMTPHTNDLRVMLKLYGIEPESPQGEAILVVARQARKRGGWWHSFNKYMPEYFGTFVGLETAASMIREYENALVPGLLQTEDYARAVLLAGPVTPNRADVDKQLALRVERQQLLDSDDPPELRVVMDEGLLHRHIGGAKVMRAQIEHLIELGQRPNIKLHVLPYQSGAHPGLEGTFTLLDFPPPPTGYPDTSEPRVIYIESMTSSLYLEKPNEIAMYNAAWDGLCGLASSPSDSERIMRTISDDLSKTR